MRQKLGFIFIGDSIINIQARNNMKSKVLPPMVSQIINNTQGTEELIGEKGITHYLTRMNIDDTHNLSESKSNDVFSPVASSGKIQIVHRKYKGKSSSQIFVRDQDKLNKISSEKKKKVFHIPGEKRKKLCKQIFKTSDRISYDFNKYEPFSIGNKKSISEAISEAQNVEVENVSLYTFPNLKLIQKFIKANNYYLNNFAMGGDGKKNSFISFKLNEILKEK